MGRWVQVACTCTMRVPLRGLRGQDFERLITWTTASEQEQDAVRALRERFQGFGVYDVYMCGHQEGQLYQTGPHALLSIGEALHAMDKRRMRFPLFQRLSDYDAYVDELLPFAGQEVVDWRHEIRYLLQLIHNKEHNKEAEALLLAGFPGLGVEEIWRAVLLAKYNQILEHWRWKAEEQAAVPPMAYPFDVSQPLDDQIEYFISVHLERVRTDEISTQLLKQHLDTKLLDEDVDAALLRGLSLCEASLVAGNPILFML